MERQRIAAESSVNLLPLRQDEFLPDLRVWMMLGVVLVGVTTTTIMALALFMLNPKIVSGSRWLNWRDVGPSITDCPSAP